MASYGVHRGQRPEDLGMLGGVIIVDGPLSDNSVYLNVLQSLNSGSSCFASHDDLEGTARGAWLLANWTTLQPATHLTAMNTTRITGLGLYHASWLKKLS